MKNIKINIPEGYVIDLENSDLNTGKVSFKKKELTYEDVAKSLFMRNQTYYLDSLGKIFNCSSGTMYYNSKINCTSEKQIKKLLAMNQLMNVAKYLNGNWEPDFKREEPKFFIYINDKNNVIISANYFLKEHFVYFKTEDLAQEAIDILGEETIRLIFENY